MTKIKYDYLYLDKDKEINGVEKFEAIRIRVYDDDRWEAELKGRRFAKDNKLGKLAGGCFSDNCLPSNFKRDYKIYYCPFDYKPAKENKHDKFIADLIEYEENMEYVIF